MISFYPGPSRVHNEIPEYVAEAFKSGILSANHRSDAFVALSRETIILLRRRLSIPEDYTIFFTSSATECWEIIGQSLILQQSLHVFNGAFGQKWFDYTSRIRKATSYTFGVEEELRPNDVYAEGCDVLCVTQNETSNGSQVSNGLIRQLRKKHPHTLLAVDATSSMAGIMLDIEAADVWFASVQKCFGLPAGLGLMICSPAAIRRALEFNEQAHYNSLTFMKQMMDKWQTSYTPNVMAIYLLHRVLEKSKPIEKVHDKIVARYGEWMDFLDRRSSMSHLIKNKTVQSYTVVPVTASPEVVTRIKREAKESGLLLGEGYGPWKETTFRIANFPALKKHEIKLLMKFLKKFS